MHAFKYSSKYVTVHIHINCNNEPGKKAHAATPY